MRAWLLTAFLLIQGSLLAQTAPPTATPAPSATSNNNEADTSSLIKVKRVYVDSFGDDAVSKELQSMVVSSLVATRRFKVTENRDRADAILKGTATEKTAQEVHAYGDSTAVGSAGGGYSTTAHGASHGGFAARHLGISDSSVNTETINEARVAMRLVNPDGDVIWTTTQESKGAKYKGATADAADKCVKKLIRDLDKLQGPVESGPAPPPVVTPSEPR